MKRTILFLMSFSGFALASITNPSLSITFTLKNATSGANQYLTSLAEAKNVCSAPNIPTDVNGTYACTISSSGTDIYAWFTIVNSEIAPIAPKLSLACYDYKLGDPLFWPSHRCQQGNCFDFILGIPKTKNISAIQYTYDAAANQLSCTAENS